MTDDRFDELMNELVGGGLPITLIVPKLMLCVRALIEGNAAAEKRLEDFVREEHAAQERLEADDFPFDPIETGQQFPEGIKLHGGRCEQCGREGKQAWLRLKFGDITSPDKHCCAECLADFVMGGMGQVYALTVQNKWQQLAGEKRR